MPYFPWKRYYILSKKNNILTNIRHSMDEHTRRKLLRIEWPPSQNAFHWYARCNYKWPDQTWGLHSNLAKPVICLYKFLSFKAWISNTHQNRNLLNKILPAKLEDKYFRDVVEERTILAIELIQNTIGRNVIPIWGSDNRLIVPSQHSVAGNHYEDTICVFQNTWNGKLIQKIIHFLKKRSHWALPII